MKIAFIGQKGIPAKTGGVERHVEFLSQHLANLGLEILVYNRRGYLANKQEEWQGVKLISKPFINTKNLANISHTLLASLDVIRRRPDVIHYHGVGPSLLLWLPKIFLPKTKFIATLHSFDYDNDKWSAFAKFMLRLGESFMCRFADEIITLTPATQRYVLEKHKRQSYLIPNGTEIKDESLNDSVDILQEWNLDKRSYIFSASRLIRLKGIQYLISAYNNLKTDKKLVIAGEGEYETELKRLAGDNKNILFIGNQSGQKLRALYTNTYLFVQSSEMEGMSLSLLEAMGHGAPCLASDILANKEALADCGYYFKTQDTKDLEVKLNKLLNNSDEIFTMAQKSFKRAQLEYTWDIVATKTLEVYK